MQCIFIFCYTTDNHHSIVEFIYYVINISWRCKLKKKFLKIPCKMKYILILKFLIFYLNYSLHIPPSFYCIITKYISQVSQFHNVIYEYQKKKVCGTVIKLKLINIS